MLRWKEQGALLFGLSDKPDEASIPTEDKVESSGGDTCSDREATKGDRSKATKILSRQVRRFNVKHQNSEFVNHHLHDRKCDESNPLEL